MSQTASMDINDIHERLASPPKGYALSGKIMLSAIVILFAVVVFVVCLHIYARWYLLRARRRNLRRRRTAHLVFHVDPNNPNATVAAPGLDAAVLSSLPVFVYSSETHPDALECAVCLSEFEENEKGRLLPKCNHSFHTDCIDMWFHSHSTCPLCRSPVEPQILAPVDENRFEVVVNVDDEPRSSSGLCSTCRHDEEVTSLPSSSSSSLGDRRKGLDLTGVTIEIPRRNESDIESAVSSPASRGYKSPVTRFLRILSMNRRASPLSPSSGVGTSHGSVGAELDIERGVDESTQQKSGSAAEMLVSGKDSNSHATTL